MSRLILEQRQHKELCAALFPLDIASVRPWVVSHGSPTAGGAGSFSWRALRSPWRQGPPPFAPETKGIRDGRRIDQSTALPRPRIIRLSRTRRRALRRLAPATSDPGNQSCRNQQNEVHGRHRREGGARGNLDRDPYRRGDSATTVPLPAEDTALTWLIVSPPSLQYTSVPYIGPHKIRRSNDVFGPPWNFEKHLVCRRRWMSVR